MPDPFGDTVKKLQGLADGLRWAAREGRFGEIAPHVEALRQYTACAYCRQFRQDLQKSYAGVCGACPCHTLGERTEGRQRAYNGCYARAPYREMVRLAQWFRTNPDASSAALLAAACESVIADMQANKEILA